MSQSFDAFAKRQERIDVAREWLRSWLVDSMAATGLARAVRLREEDDAIGALVDQLFPGEAP